jgi:hypothetical protein
MNFYDENNEGDGFFDDSFHYNSIEREEECSTSKALSEIYSALLLEPKKVEMEIAKEATATDNDDDLHAYFRGPSVGYSAHCNTVDEIELDSWRSAFPYLTIQGSNIKGGCAEDESFLVTSKITNRISSIDDPSSLDDFNLCVIGKKMPIYSVSPSSSPIANEGEIIESEGYLEEVIIMNHETCYNSYNGESAEAHKSPTDLLSPKSTINEEVVSEIFDCIWPDVIDSCAPLIHKVIQLAMDGKLDGNPDTEEGGLSWDFE